MNSPQEALEKHRKALQNGGDEAIAIFIGTAIEFLNSGAPDLASEWVGIAVPALPKCDQLFALNRAADAIFGPDFDFDEAAREEAKLQ